MSERTLADTVRMHELTFGICAPFSCFQLLVLIVCAAVTASAESTMTQLRRCRFSSGVRSQKYVCQRRATRHAHTCGGGCSRSRGMGCAEQARLRSAYQTQLRRPSARGMDTRERRTARLPVPAGRIESERSIATEGANLFNGLQALPTMWRSCRF